MAVLSLVFAFVFAPAGLVLGVVARKRVGCTGERGKAVATAGIVVSLAVAAVTALVLVLGVGAARDAATVGPQAPAPSVTLATPVAPTPVVPTPDGPVPSVVKPGEPTGADQVVVEQMKADALEMVRAQERYRRQVPAEPGLEVSFSDTPVLVGTTTVTPHHGNIISVMPVPATEALPQGGYCVTVVNDKAPEPVLWDSIAGGGAWLGADLPEDEVAAGACSVQAAE